MVLSDKRRKAEQQLAYDKVYVTVPLTFYVILKKAVVDENGDGEIEDEEVYSPYEIHQAQILNITVNEYKIYVGAMEKVNAGEEVTLKEVKALALVEGCKTVSKQSVADFLTSVYGDKVVVNRRANYIANGRLLLADTHYKVFDESELPPKCFVYTYELKNGNVFFLFNLDKAKEKDFKEIYPEFIRSRFPRSKNSRWVIYIPSKKATQEEIYERLQMVYEEFSKDMCLP